MDAFELMGDLQEVADNQIDSVESRGIFDDILGVRETEMAPSMEIQAQEISEVFLEFPELQYDQWKELSAEERIDVLQKFESEIAKIEHREPIVVRGSELGNCVYGQYSPQTNDIQLNRDLLESNKESDHVQIMQTYFHEGRHAYQFYNLLVERREPNAELFNSWDVNLNVLGYNSGDYGIFGYEEYYTQPVEVDARVFAETVISKLDLR